jgi:hypothetical protein
VVILIFSYYFDAERTHVLNCGFQVENITTKPDKSIDTTFTAYIEEVENEVIKKKESYTATFTFTASTTEDQHDIDFIRTRYASQKKWIFEVRNNKDPNQKVIIGLISDTANKNPLGLDIYYENDKYDAELKANNLSQLEQNYIVPEIVQTVASGDFNDPGLSDFTQTFIESIPPQTKFKIEMNIAPTSVNPKSGLNIFDLNIENVGTVSLLTGGIEYLKTNGTPSDIQQAYFSNNVTSNDFFQNGFKTNSKLTIEGDGAGLIIINYAGLNITGTYDHTKPINSMFLHSYEDQDSTLQSQKIIKHYLDNIKVTYTK